MSERSRRFLLLLVAVTAIPYVLTASRAEQPTRLDQQRAAPTDIRSTCHAWILWQQDAKIEVGASKTRSG
jgi:hypothetical protein